jgi:hypothetical protein
MYSLSTDDVDIRLGNFRELLKSVAAHLNLFGSSLWVILGVQVV